MAENQQESIMANGKKYPCRITNPCKRVISLHRNAGNAQFHAHAGISAARIHRNRQSGAGDCHTLPGLSVLLQFSKYN